MTYTKPKISFFLGALVAAFLTWPSTSFGQDCDFWSGECPGTVAKERPVFTPKSQDEVSEGACDFWSGECQDVSEADHPSEHGQSEEACNRPESEELLPDECPQVEATLDDFWTQPHTEEVERRRVAEVARIEAERQAELRRIEIEEQEEAKRLAEIKATRQKRLALEREREKQRQEARREEIRLAEARRRAAQPRGPSTAELLVGALQTIEREVGREVNRMNAETERRRAANEILASQRRAQEQAKRDREFDAKIAALEKQERDAQKRADLRAAQKREFAQRLKREKEAQAKQKERARALTASRSHGTTFDSRNKSSRSSSQSGNEPISRPGPSWMENSYSACVASANNLELERQSHDSVDAIAAYKAACSLLHRLKYSLASNPSRLQCTVRGAYLADAKKALTEKGLGGYTAYAGQAWNTWESKLGCR